ncbi:telomerase protein component 1 isoform X2 [Takifugu flavidus]|nr:telomerase protein component 1 isoform X2 [Takifugu flavidus]
MELGVPETEGSQRESVVIRHKDFVEIDRREDMTEMELKDKKCLLLNAVCCSLVNKSIPPGQKDWDTEKSVWTVIKNIARDISVSDPQFLLKVAVYTRQQLNIRITANFLLALAASQPSTKPHVRRYFSAAVQLPSDWLEVVRIYSTCFSSSLPMCLKKALVDKFKEFSEYQLAKYNTRKHRCKHNHNKGKSKKPSHQQLKQWANLVRSDSSILSKFLQITESKTVVDKKQSEFSLKKMIKRLHIKEPAEHVMAILGKKYPADIKVFTHSGMKGVWEREKAGQRMKLRQPETWERLLSLKGNNSSTWEKLIDNKSLPFMAMLRNLRNMITKGISEAHHKKILSRLTNKKAVIQSRQFPFRFLAAYKIILELRNLASKQTITPSQDILKGILKKIPKSRHFRSKDWDTTSRSRIKVTLGVPFVYRQYQQKRAGFQKAVQKHFSVALLDRYLIALETAVQISCHYNVPPLPGRTIILLSDCINNNNSRLKQDFCLPPDPEQKDDKEEEGQHSRRRERIRQEDDKLNPSVLEVAVLLSLMIGSSAEDFKLYLSFWRGLKEIKIESDVLLDNVKGVIKQLKNSAESNEEGDSLFTLLKGQKVDNIIILTEFWLSDYIDWSISNYRKDVNDKALVVKIFMSSESAEYNSDKNCVNLTGFSDQILRFVAERGSSRLLDHVEHIDRLYNIPPPGGAKVPETINTVVQIPVTPQLRWRSVRVFISSTFRDMHAERDILVQSVFPELRRRAAAHCLHMQEVELRWGVTEEESLRATELCLSEVSRSQMMVGILGERYGLVPPKPVLPDLPQYSWLASAPAGLSITEMEIRHFEAFCPKTASQRMFCYFRDPNIIKSIPVAWRADFVAESKEAESKVASLKKMLLLSDIKVTENYPCEWGGVVSGKPYLKNLDQFGKTVLEDLWKAVEEQFVEVQDKFEATSDDAEQEMHQGALQRQFFGRAKLLIKAVEMVEKVWNKGGMMFVEGGPGEGKTVFMAALAAALRTGEKAKEQLICDVISYSTTASQAARSVENLLRYLIRWFRKMDCTEKDSPIPNSYKKLLLEFQSTLSNKRKRPVAFLVDGVDLVQDGTGQANSEWIPQQLPQGICLVMSVTSNAVLLQTLAKKRNAVQFVLGQLTLSDRKEIVMEELDTFGKKLSDSAFNNQLQILTMKKGAVSPFYLHLACETLRNFASFDKLKENVQALPQSLEHLVAYGLDRLCSQYRHLIGLRWALAALTVSATGMRARELYSTLNTCNELSSRDGPMTWQELLQLSRNAKGHIPMTTFTYIVLSLQSLIGMSHCHNTNDLLILTNPEVRIAFENILLPSESDRTRAHLVLAAHLWASADQQGTDTFHNCEANYIQHLPSSLIQSGQPEALHQLLSSYYFLYANVHHGLLHHLLDTYISYDKMNNSEASFCSSACLEDCRNFLHHHSLLLSSWPSLFIQQALNEPPNTSAHTWAQGLVKKGGLHVMRWLNNSQQDFKHPSKLVSTFSTKPTCMVLSSDGQMMVVGTGHGMLHFIDTQSGLEVKSLVSSCDGISSCVFLKDGHLATTSFNGKLEMWDIGSGCRTAFIEAHTNAITASDVTVDMKHVATVSLDSMLKVWSSTKAYEVAAWLSPGPLNCVSFHPEEHLLAAGCWNGNVIMWNWLQNKSDVSFCGHKSSVRSLSFSSSSTMCSGSVSGEIRVWSVPNFTCVGCFQAHSGATEVLTFLDEGRMLLSASSDHTLKLWSGGLGRSVAALKSECEGEPCLKKQKLVSHDPAALCVAVNGDCVAVGYHGAGIKLFSLDTGEMTKTPEVLDVSILCMMWVNMDHDEGEPELLVAGRSDKCVGVLKRNKRENGTLGTLKVIGLCGTQHGDILALAQNATYLATASDDCTIALWLLSHLCDMATQEPQSLLSSHSGGVTCLAFSPDGGQLLSGGKDLALIVWDVSGSPAVLSKSLSHAHKDWITSCVWSPHCVISSSNDGRLCLWDLQSGQCLKEISWKSRLTSVCCLGQYVIASCSEGMLHVWMWESSVEICHISAHKQLIHHCTLLPNTDETKDDGPEEITVFTASEDGTVQLWKPLQVQHFSTFQGHNAAVCGVVDKKGLSEFLSISQDCTLRCWTLMKETASTRAGPVTALCLSPKDNLLLAGYESGLIEIWQHTTVVGYKQTFKSGISAISVMPDNQFAVSYTKPSIDIWKLVWNQKSNITSVPAVSLLKVNTYKLKEAAVRLSYCTVLIGVSESGRIFHVSSEEENWMHIVSDWEQRTRILGLIPNDEKSMWLVGEEAGEILIGFIFAMGPHYSFRSAFSSMKLESGDEGKSSLISAVTVNKDFVVCGDVRGNMWFIQPTEPFSLSNRKLVHNDRISVLRVTEQTIISASYDRTVKLWDRDTKKQVGMFMCEGPVVHLEVNPANPTELVCGDGQGNLYFLTWTQ